MYLFGLVGFLFIQSLQDIKVVADTFSSTQSLCNEVERSALLQFKESIVVNNCASHDPYSFPKVASWKLDGVSGGDCCSWDGIECGKDSGHVIGLDLSSSCLYGSINTNSSLFSLVHLQNLNMAFNDFNNSNIPVGLANLSMLKHLNLSNSSFSGQIPPQISGLSNLVSLDLSFNIDSSYQRLLKLTSPNFSSLLPNLTRIEKLHLSYVDMSSTVPLVLNNLSSLTSLHLDDCGLLGEFPPGIFQLPNLKFLLCRATNISQAICPTSNGTAPLKA